MIYTVTLNPTLDITYLLEGFSFERPLQAIGAQKSPGGKGINVSRALRGMGDDSVAIGLIGGFTGQEVRALLLHEGLDLRFIEIANETRTNVVLLGRDDGRELVIRSAGPAVSAEESGEFIDLIFDVVQPPGYLVLSGSIPPGIRDDVYADLISQGKARGMKTVLDSDGKALEEGVKAGPDLIKPNREEMERLAGRELADRDDVVSFAREVVAGGVEAVAVSLGRRGALMVDSRGAWLGEVPPIDNEDTVGAGDSMVAGLLMGLSRSLPLQEAFRMGLACGVSAVLNPGPVLCTPATYAEALKRVKVHPA